MTELNGEGGNQASHVDPQVRERIESLEGRLDALTSQHRLAVDLLLRMRDLEVRQGLPIPAAPSARRVVQLRGARDSSSEDRRSERFAACTIISRNYLSHARVLAQSFLDHEPAAPFYVLVVDGLPSGVQFGIEGVHLVDMSELAIPNIHEMCFKYDVIELCTAVKPSLLAVLFEKYSEDAVVYLDPDILVTAPFYSVREALESAPIVLTPHILSPIPDDGRTPSEQDILISGSYNLGFIGLRRSSEALRFLRWWESRLENGCAVDVANGLFTDQKWVDLVPAMYEGTLILRDETCNVAFWNLHERTLTSDGSNFFVNGRPLTFFHVSGFDPRRVRTLSKHQNRIEVEDGSALADLLDRYAALQFASGYEATTQFEYGHSRLDNGTRVDAVLRQLYLGLPPGERSRFGNPFAAENQGSFFQWASTPRPDKANLSPFLEELYRVRYDLASAFPEVRGRDRDAFLQWALDQGTREMGYGEELIQPSMLSIPSEEPRPLSIAPKTSRQLYSDVVRETRRAMSEVLPVGAVVAVVSKGDQQLVSVPGRDAWHFPRDEDGRYPGYYPADSAAAIAHLERLRENGAQFIVFPETARWWLQRPEFARFAEHLERTYTKIYDRQGACIMFSLGAEGLHLETPGHRVQNGQQPLRRKLRTAFWRVVPKPPDRSRIGAK